MLRRLWGEQTARAGVVVHQTYAMLVGRQEGMVSTSHAREVDTVWPGEGELLTTDTGGLGLEEGVVWACLKGAGGEVGVYVLLGGGIRRAVRQAVMQKSVVFCGCVVYVPTCGSGGL